MGFNTLVGNWHVLAPSTCGSSSSSSTRLTRLHQLVMAYKSRKQRYGIDCVLLLSCSYNFIKLIVFIWEENV